MMILIACAAAVYRCELRRAILQRINDYGQIYKRLIVHGHINGLKIDVNKNKNFMCAMQ